MGDGIAIDVDGHAGVGCRDLLGLVDEEVLAQHPDRRLARVGIPDGQFGPTARGTHDIVAVEGEATPVGHVLGQLLGRKLVAVAGKPRILGRLGSVVRENAFGEPSGDGLIEIAVVGQHGLGRELGLLDVDLIGIVSGEDVLPVQPGAPPPGDARGARPGAVEDVESARGSLDGQGIPAPPTDDAHRSRLQHRTIRAHDQVVVAAVDLPTVALRGVDRFRGVEIAGESKIVDQIPGLPALERGHELGGHGIPLPGEPGFVQGILRAIHDEDGPHQFHDVRPHAAAAFQDQVRDLDDGIHPAGSDATRFNALDEGLCQIAHVAVLGGIEPLLQVGQELGLGLRERAPVLLGPHGRSGHNDEEEQKEESVNHAFDLGAWAVAIIQSPRSW